MDDGDDNKVMDELMDGDGTPCSAGRRTSLEEVR